MTKKSNMSEVIKYNIDGLIHLLHSDQYDGSDALDELYFIFVKVLNIDSRDFVKILESLNQENINEQIQRIKAIEGW